MNLRLVGVIIFMFVLCVFVFWNWFAVISFFFCLQNFNLSRECNLHNTTQHNTQKMVFVGSCNNDINCTNLTQSEIDDIVNVAKTAEIVLFAGGMNWHLATEDVDRYTIELPANQSVMFKQIYENCVSQIGNILITVLFYDAGVIGLFVFFVFFCAVFFYVSLSFCITCVALQTSKQTINKKTQTDHYLFEHSDAILGVGYPGRQGGNAVVSVELRYLVSCVFL